MEEGQKKKNPHRNWDCPLAVCVCPVTMNDMEEGLNEVASWVNSMPGGNASLEGIIHNPRYHNHM